MHNKVFIRFLLGTLLIGSLFSAVTQTSMAATPTPTASAKPRPKSSVTPTPSPTPSVSPATTPSDQQTTENLKDRIDRVLEQRQEKLKELEQQGQRRRIVIGEVLRISERTVTLRTPRGNQGFIAGPDVPLMKDGKRVTIDDIAVGDWMGVIGFQEKENIQAQSVFISSNSYRPPAYLTVIGTLKENTKTLITAVGPDKNLEKFLMTKLTKIQANDGSTLKREALQTDTQVIVIGVPSGDQNAAVLIKSLAGQKN